MDILAHHYELWHDRAAFHFLISSEQQQRYVENLSKALRPGGHVIMATFSVEVRPAAPAPQPPDRGGHVIMATFSVKVPLKCSGLPVQRYSSEELERILGSAFVLKKKSKELHITPGGVEQMYLYCLFEKTP
ncbi:class I SAM-dependent methyltransferase [Roseiflexus castenholzii]|uniref:hypothetical protein n=1 Tax=Roseiflexus castenholzii TaxID=120962 RepID=UPI0018DC1057|nr:hypothetical protein [Roseiflexus castenholzii]